MINAIRYIGEYALQGKSIDDTDVQLELFIQNPASTPDYKHVLSIMINRTKNNTFKFEGVRLEQYTKEKLDRYMYRRGTSGRTSDISPTSRITEIPKTFDNKILRWFDKNSNGEIELDNEISTFKELRDCLVANKNIILSELKLKIESFKKEDKGIVTLLINGKYVGEYPIFKKLFIQKAISDFYNKHSSTSKSENKVCSICRKDNKTVYGFVSTFNSYSVNKIGFVSGFDRRDAWKNYPVCQECALTLEKGKKYIQEYLDYKLYGLNYYVIPKILIPNKNNGNYEIFDILEKFKEETEGNIKIEKDHQKLLSHDEKEITCVLAEQKNYLNYNFLFYDEGKNRNEFKILLYIRGIYPSRLKKLFESKKYVDKKSIFKNSNINFTFGNIKYFFDKKEFLDISNSIFTNMKIDYYFLLKNIVKKIQEEFVNNIPTKLSTFLGFQLLNYLNYLNLLERFDGKIDMNEKNDINNINKNINKIDVFKENELDLEEKIDLLFKEFPGFFTRPEQKAVFLEGALAQLLLDVQRIERKIKIDQTPPFYVKLHDLKLDKKKVMRLFPEIQHKFEEYNKNYYRELETIISQYMIMAGENWKISDDDISYYFVIGMNLKSFFKSKKKELNDEKEFNDEKELNNKKVNNKKEMIKNEKEFA